jgi:hypothetical protein
MGNDPRGPRPICGSLSPGDRRARSLAANRRAGHLSEAEASGPAAQNQWGWVPESLRHLLSWATAPTRSYRVRNPWEDLDRLEWFAHAGRAAQFEGLPLEVLANSAADEYGRALQSAKGRVAGKFPPRTILEFDVKYEAAGLAGCEVCQEFIRCRE